MKKTLVLGASDNPARYSYKAIRALRGKGHDVVAIGNRVGSVDGVQIAKGQEPQEGIDTVTLYLNPTNQQPYYDYILNLKPKRVVFNPGTENAELERMVEGAGIDAVEACTLVLLATGQY